MNLASAFESSVNKNKQKSALFWGERAYSYADLWDQSLLIAGQLRQQFKVQPGDRVGLWLKNCAEFVPSFFGIVQAGAVVVPLNNFLKPAEVNFIIADAGIDVLITDSELGAQFPALVAARPALKLLQVGAAAPSICAPEPPIETTADTPAPSPRGEGWDEGDRRVRGSGRIHEQ